jgi:hypothetical protein
MEDGAIPPFPYTLMAELVERQGQAYLFCHNLSILKKYHS